jgi:hypothetical protein
MLVHTITENDLGYRPIKTKHGMIWPVDLMGPIQPRDVGKRIYLNGGIYQVENDEQLEARNGKTIRINAR